MAAGVLVLLSAWLVWMAGRELEVAPDESEWVTAGYRTYELVRDLEPPSAWESAYSALGLEGWGNMSPPLGKLFIGLAVAPFTEPGEQVRFISTWPFDYQANRLAGNIPPFRLLTPARICIALFGAACLVLVYICSVQLVRRRYLPMLAPIALFCTLSFQQHSTRLYTDVPQLALLLAAIVALNRHLASRREMGFYIAMILAGLSCAVKFSTGPFVSAALVFFWVVRGQSFKRRLSRSLAIVLIPCAAFIGVNPYLYPAPVSRTLELIEGWSSTKHAQQDVQFLKDQAVTSRASRIALVATRGALSPQLANRFSSRMHGYESVLGAIAGLGLLGTALYFGRRRKVDTRRLAVFAGISLCAVAVASCLDGPAVLLPILSAAGIAQLFSLARSRDAAGSMAIHYLTVLGVFIVVTALWLPFDWSRYYLPTLVLMSVVYAAGAAQVVDLIDGDEARPGNLSAG